MPYATVSYPIERHLDQQKVAQVAEAAGCPVAKQGVMHKSDDAGKLHAFALLKFEYTKAADGKKLLSALGKFGETRQIL